METPYCFKVFCLILIICLITKQTQEQKYYKKYYYLTNKKYYFIVWLSEGKCLMSSLKNDFEEARTQNTVIFQRA